MASSDVVSSLWIGEALSPIEQACLASFLAHGHRVELYTYDHVANVPNGVQIVDGRSILPKESIFTYREGPGAGSPSAFSNVFRYKLLAERGGWWVDTDQFCLRPFEIKGDFAFGFERPGRVNSCVLKAPAGHPLCEYLYTTASRIGANAHWGEAGPELLTTALNKFGLAGQALPAAAFCPTDYTDWQLAFRADARSFMCKATETSFGVHLWNEMLRRNAMPKFGPYERGSYFAELAQTVGVSLDLVGPEKQIDAAPEGEAKAVKGGLLSRLNINIRRRPR